MTTDRNTLSVHALFSRLLFIVSFGPAMLFCSCDATAPAAETKMAPLSFLVLPFTNSSGDADKDYVAANLTADLTAGLSRIPGALVIAHSSALALASQSIPLIEIGHRFGVQFVVRGDAFTEGAHIHVAATLIRAENEEQLWSEDFKRDFAALWPVEREIGMQIAQRLGTTIADAVTSMEPLPAQDVAALDSLLRAQVIANMPVTPQTITQARGLFAMALRSVPLAAEAKAGLAAVDLLAALNQRGGASALALTECERLLGEALASDPRNVRALETLGALRRATGKPREALAAYEGAVMANRNDANAHAQIGRLKLDLGEPRQALPHIELALRLSPLDAQRALWFTFAGLAHLYIEEPGAARSWLEKSVAAAPQFVTALIFLAAAQELDGLDADARRTLEAAQRINPTLSMRRVEQQFAPNESQARTQWSRIADALLRIGLPN
jgi:TolB-like protein/Tfp pilus assembly protein PilF